MIEKLHFHLPQKDPLPVTKEDLFASLNGMLFFATTLAEAGGYSSSLMKNVNHWTRFLSIIPESVFMVRSVNEAVSAIPGIALAGARIALLQQVHSYPSLKPVALMLDAYGISLMFARASKELYTCWQYSKGKEPNPFFVTRNVCVHGINLFHSVYKAAMLCNYFRSPGEGLIGNLKTFSEEEIESSIEESNQRIVLNGETSEVATPQVLSFDVSKLIDRVLRREESSLHNLDDLCKEQTAPVHLACNQADKVNQLKRLLNSVQESKKSPLRDVFKTISDPGVSEELKGKDLSIYLATKFRYKIYFLTSIKSLLDIARWRNPIEKEFRFIKGLLKDLIVKFDGELTELEALSYKINSLSGVIREPYFPALLDPYVKNLSSGYEKNIENNNNHANQEIVARLDQIGHLQQFISNLEFDIQEVLKNLNVQKDAIEGRKKELQTTLEDLLGSFQRFRKDRIFLALDFLFKQDVDEGLLSIKKFH